MNPTTFGGNSIAPPPPAFFYHHSITIEKNLLPCLPNIHISKAYITNYKGNKSGVIRFEEKIVGRFKLLEVYWSFDLSKQAT
ncbi:hypothetical protein L6452_35578 [Arctium lappa]|uniref:Uncharacterized protein n=1 Tax=Arctium lappa TaxID=4217 RepID=A0ACB8Y627_ARCLA|nr:hypothetical protein L6452_35578 [Arctium lappa]